MTSLSGETRGADVPPILLSADSVAKPDESLENSAGYRLTQGLILNINALTAMCLPTDG
jgi:hypothetical protein